MTSPLSDDELDLIRDLRRRVGWQPHRIADVMGVGLTTVYRALDDGTRRRGAELVEDALWLLEAGEHPSHVAQRLGVSIAALEAALRRAGHPRADVQAERRLHDRGLAA